MANKIPKFIGEGDTGYYLYAVQINGVNPKPPFNRETIAQIEQWKKTAKKDAVFTKPRKGQKPKPQLKRWLESVEPKEFYAVWDLKVDDDTRDIFYK